MTRRAAILVLVTVSALATIPLLVAGWKAANDTQRLVELERLQLSSLAAASADHVLSEAFAEIESLAVVILSSVDTPLGCPARGGPERLPQGSQGFSLAFFLLDCDGKAIAWSPVADENNLGGRATVLGVFGLAAATEDRYVSDSFIVGGWGHATAILGLPLHSANGDRVGTLVSFMDLEQHFSETLTGPIRALGTTAHADLIGGSGLVLASTQHEFSATSGRHPDSYPDLAATARPEIRRMRVRADDGEGTESTWHVMAYSPLNTAHWGVAIGADEAETFAVARAQRRRVARWGIASVGAIVGGILAVALMAGPGREA